MHGAHSLRQELHAVILAAGGIRSFRNYPRARQPGYGDRCEVEVKDRLGLTWVGSPECGVGLPHRPPNRPR